ncbi:molybdopterin molybdotransferase MoeA [Tenacibaculum jejuense]|uniref:Molybdopterin molybdenumtransferase n=1 Tax=Tenacibaculum jejuense TaxID=584609 RepID=A0A238UCV4_9FLAO|nr:gephyrin-like molybdotransferase Glp [Tenacibaculum jejuense]SNR17001.1 Molybdopterin biosynthesis protein MoeA [Tenacibaculum jejuense]
MISVSEAIQHIENYCQPNKIIEKPIQEVLGLVLAEAIVSPINMPPFKQSSMDGYAFIHNEISSFTVVGEVQAGDSKNVVLQEGEAVRIFTGARVPDQADTVVMQEHTSVEGDQLTINELPKKSSNVRPLGEQIKTGAIALEEGTVLNEAAIGFIAGLGLSTVKVYQKPKVSILITGNELKAVGEVLEEGQVYDSNSITLQLALHRLGIDEVEIVKVEDTFEATKTAIKNQLDFADVILVSGGISVGDYDFVKRGLEENNVSEVFYKVNQKPGKPLWFGEKEEKLVFALPGNPASSLSCFYSYVLPVIKAQLGYKDYHLPRSTAKATNDIKNAFGKTLFLKGIIENGQATQLTGQASSMLKSFAVANGLLIVPEDVQEIKKGEEITYIKLS